MGNKRASLFIPFHMMGNRLYGAKEEGPFSQLPQEVILNEICPRLDPVSHLCLLRTTSALWAKAGPVRNMSLTWVLRHGARAHVVRIAPHYKIALSHIRAIGLNSEMTDFQEVVDLCLVLTEQRRVALLAAWIEVRADSFAHQLLATYDPINLDFVVSKGDLRDAKALFKALLSRDDFAALPGIYVRFENFIHSKEWLPHWIGLIRTQVEVERSMALVARFPQIPKAIMEGNLHLSDDLLAWGAALLTHWARVHRGVVVFPQATENIFEREWDQDSLRYWFHLVGVMEKHALVVLQTAVTCLNCCSPEPEETFASSDSVARKRVSIITKSPFVTLSRRRPPSRAPIFGSGSLI
jgi:hypothetical protein